MSATDNLINVLLFFNSVSTTMNSSWRARNNSVHTNYGHLSNTRSLRREQSNVDDILKEEKGSSIAKKSMIKSLLIDKKALEKSEMLIDGMKKLKEMDLLTGKGLTKMKLPGVIRHEKVHNDYHLPTANPGYSRNYAGKFYTK